jgi:hypothetical protein
MELMHGLFIVGGPYPNPNLISYFPKPLLQVFTLAGETPAKPPAARTDLRLKSPAKSPAGGQDFPAPAPVPAGG